MKWPSLGRALAHRNYRLFFIGQSFSLVGTWIQMVGLTWLVYRLTNSPLLLGTLGFSLQSPMLFIAPVAGVMADRWNRHHALLLTQISAMGQAILLVLLSWTGAIEIWHIFLLSFALGTVNAFDMPLRQSFLIDLVPRRDDLPNAIALNSSMVNGARLVGPSVAGMLITMGGETLCFLFNAVSYLAVLIALLRLRNLPPHKVAQRPPVLHELKEGLAYAVHFRPIFAILLLLSLVSLTGMPLSLLLPIFASEILGGGPSVLGFLMGASGLGALVAALYLASRRTVLGLGRQMTLAVMTFGVAMIAFSFSEHFWLSFSLLLVIGFCMMMDMAGSNTLLQTIVDDDKRGRVMSLYTMAFIGTAPFGSLLAGRIADSFGAPLAVRLGGCACIVGAIVFGISLPRLREMVRPIYERAGILPPMDTALQATNEVFRPPEET